MLDESRIKEAEKNVQAYLQDKLLWKHSGIRSDILSTYRRNFEESLMAAQKLYDLELSNLWVIVTSYYAMYYIVNAVLYKVGYKVGSKVSHKVTADSIIVFIRNKLKKELLEEYEEAREEALDIIGKKTDEVIGFFDKELEKRSSLQYESTEQIKRTKAQTSLDRAKRFIFEMKKLL